MLRTLTICLIFFLLTGWVTARSQPKDSPGTIMALIQQSKPDTNRVKLQLQLGSYYLFKSGEYKNDLDSALNFFTQAMQLSTVLNSIKWQNAALILKGNCFLEGNDIKSGKACLMQVINYYHKTGQMKLEAESWVRLGDNIPGFPNLLDDKAFCYGRARILFRTLNDKLSVITMLKNAADMHLNQGKLDLSEKELFDVLGQLKAIHYQKLQYTYDLLASLYNLKGELQKRLYYQLEAIKYAEATIPPSGREYFYLRAVLVYADLGMHDKEEFYCYKALGTSKKGKSAYFINELSWLTKDLILTNRSQEALRLLKQNFKPGDLLNLDQKRVLFKLFGNCYTALKQYDLAEKYYVAMLKINEALADETQYQTVANFYIITQQFTKAAFYLKKLQGFPNSLIGPLNLREIELMRFKVDSASGNYLSAIGHFELYKKVNDSLFNATKSKQVAELGIKYETAQKEKSIAALESRGLVQRTELQKANLQRNITFIGIVMLLIIAALAYNGYRNKRRSNLKLEVKQFEINKQNLALQSLIGEKDWLLREIHHRVKNNLQTTMSLLNMQSSYISNEDALEAIRSSQRRMHAMSLIHQKLYQSCNLTYINMDVYIHELVNYLKESFKGTGNISFKLQIQSIELDVAQAVPLGLIINEAITNAIKYAFPKSMKGNIAISLNRTKENRFRLTITDNGIGLPDSFDISSINSLGIKLMKGLSDQLQGDFFLNNDHGTCVMIEAQYHDILEHEFAAPKEVLI
ncbi:sensor histidine kinase [Mucilaginibacter sp. KACC 22773]|uniref:tetratricopeptide repeat-containing sensor histidine kinase n=1 Tax=Mucilaginibacter sp. KACC 22773 TaxID=3025671 RepID=UPI0023673F19|nr:sensor histidine kinase [Mucilaginibacter sp. KACC 22773]WDF79030.1 sensor histidine kinase [Mucilaginibacter sp. KACC 22773]